MPIKKKNLPKAKKRVVKRVGKPRSRAGSSIKRRTTRGRRRNPPTFIELKMGGLLKRMGIEAVPQYKIKRLGRGNYYVDFALPSLMLAIECDGKAYHSSPAQIRHDKKRQAELESLGWQVIRFTGSEIVTNISGCEQVLQQLLEGS